MSKRKLQDDGNEYDAITEAFFTDLMDVNAPLEDYAATLRGVRDRAAELLRLAEADLARGEGR